MAFMKRLQVGRTSLASHPPPWVTGQQVLPSAADVKFREVQGSSVKVKEAQGL